MLGEYAKAEDAFMRAMKMALIRRLKLMGSSLPLLSRNNPMNG
jgi:hypothetical protein